jgi:hypothetical protein
MEEVMPLQLFPQECPEEPVYLTVEFALPASVGPAQLWDQALWDGASWSPTPGNMYPSIWNLAIWDYALWGADQSWVDVSDRVLSVNVGRGFQDSTMRSWSTGTVTIILDNQDGALSPSNVEPTAPYVVNGVSSLIPGFPVRVKLTQGTATKHLFYGYSQSVQDILFGHYGEREGAAAISVDAYDEYGRFAKVKGYAGSMAGAGETLVERVTRILSGVFSGVIVSDGVSQTTFQDTDLSGGPVDELERTARAEGGAIYIGEQGEVIAKRRYSLIEDTDSVVPQQVFSDGSGVGEIPWATIDVSPVSDEHVINRAVYSMVGGAVQTYSDQVSIYRFGVRDDQSSGMDTLMCQDNSQVLSLAQWAVIMGKDAKARVNSVSILPGGDIDVLIPVVFDLSIRSLVQVIIKPPSDDLHTISRYCFVYGITTNITQGEMSVVYSLAPADSYHEYAGSRWDEGKWDTAKWFY